MSTLSRHRDDECAVQEPRLENKRGFLSRKHKSMRGPLGHHWMPLRGTDFFFQIRWVACTELRSGNEAN